MHLSHLLARTKARKEAGVAIGMPGAVPHRPAGPAADPPACRHLGDGLTGREREAASLSHSRDWRHCLNPTAPLGPHVCRCLGCGTGCRGYAPPVVVNMAAGGIGDGLLGLMAVAGLKAADPDVPVRYRVGRHAVPFVSLFGGYDELAPHDWHATGGESLPGTDVQMNAGYHADRLTNRWERYCRNIGASGVVRPNLRNPLPPTPNAGAVVLCPFSNYRDREVPVEVWSAVEAKLEAAGVPTVVAGAAGEAGRGRGFAGPKSFGSQPAELAALLAGSRCVAGNDSGPAHLAGVLGVRCVVGATRDTGNRVYGGYGCVACVERRSVHDVRASEIVAAVLGVSP